MTLVVDQEWSDRPDDRLVALPDGMWLSAGERAVTRWTADGPGRSIVRRHPWPGPLTWIPGHQEASWGPSLLGEVDPDPADLVAAVLPDLEPSARAEHALVTGALDPTGTTAFIAVRAAPGGEHGPRTRLALLDRASHDHLAILADDQPDPTAVSWNVGPLLIGIAGAVLVGRDGGGLDERSFATAAAARALSTSPHGVVAAGLGEGSVVTWEVGGTPGAGRECHDGPVLSLAWSSDGRALATGGVDGRVRVLGGASVPELDLGIPVVALAWLDDGRLVAKAGSDGGLIAVLRRQG